MPDQPTASDYLRSRLFSINEAAMQAASNPKPTLTPSPRYIGRDSSLGMELSTNPRGGYNASTGRITSGNIQPGQPVKVNGGLIDAMPGRRPVRDAPVIEDDPAWLLIVDYSIYEEGGIYVEPLVASVLSKVGSRFTKLYYNEFNPPELLTAFANVLGLTVGDFVQVSSSTEVQSDGILFCGLKYANPAVATPEELLGCRLKKTRLVVYMSAIFNEYSTDDLNNYSIPTTRLQTVTQEPWTVSGNPFFQPAPDGDYVGSGIPNSGGWLTHSYIANNTSGLSEDIYTQSYPRITTINGVADSHKITWLSDKPARNPLRYFTDGSSTPWVVSSDDCTAALIRL